MSTDGHGQSQGGEHGGGPDGHELELSERGATRDGVPQVLDRRVFFQLLVFQTPDGRDPAEVTATLGKRFAERNVPVVLYDDVNDPRGVGVLTFGEDPGAFVTTVRPILAQADLGLTIRPAFSMLGRTYSTGFEQDLAFWILERPVNTVMDETCPWHVWYPLRRNGAFAQLEPKEQGRVLREHGAIGRAYGAKNLAHDIRLACHGLDANDNEFVIGLVGSELYPLSHVVQSMRKTRQTAEFIAQMGPFFVGRVASRYRAQR